jgi:serine/threonine-protein kinase
MAFAAAGTAEAAGFEAGVASMAVEANGTAVAALGTAESARATAEALEQMTTKDTPIPPPSRVGDTWTRPADGAVMVGVPAGEFLMGSTDDDPDAYHGEKPQHTVYLDAFWIDKTEVTNAQYRKCVEAGACEEPGCWDDDRYNAPEQPVVCVNRYVAQDYAAWAGGRLPTEAEWEKAARGTDGKIYPWGDSPPDCSKANYFRCAGKPLPVGTHPDGASPYGALDMAGNVWEWVSGSRRFLRGGSWRDDRGGVRAANRSIYVEPSTSLNFIGFRCARSGSEP